MPKRPSIRDRVLEVLLDGRWYTGLEICRAVDVGFGTGVTAKIRDLRKPQFGGYIIESRKQLAESRRTGRQVWEYRLVGRDAENHVKSRGGATAARRAHNPQAEGSTPSPATTVCAGAWATSYTPPREASAAPAQMMLGGFGTMATASPLRHGDAEDEEATT